MHARSAESLQATQALAAGAARKAFGKGSAKAAGKVLSAPIDTGSAKMIAKATQKIEASYTQWISEAPSDKAKGDRSAVAKKEAAAAELLERALAETGPIAMARPDDLDLLGTACDSAVIAFSPRLTSRIKRLDDAIRTSKGAGTQAELAKVKRFEAEKATVLGGPDLARLGATFDLALEVKLRQNANLAKELATAVAAVETARSEDNLVKLRDLARKYAELFDEHAAQYAEWPTLKPPRDIVKRREFALDTLQQAELAAFDVKAAKLGPPPWPADKQAEAADLLDKARELRAVDVLRQGKSFQASGGGTSDVTVLRNAKGRTEFAFKSAAGETSNMGMEKGSGAVREAVTSVVCEAVLEQTGLDFAFPKATVARIDGKIGALIEGIGGRELPAADKLPPADSREFREIQAFQNAVPGKELQKVVLCGIVTGNILDLKWDNIFWEGEGSDATARPFDAGASFLPTSELKYQLHNRPSGSGLNVPLLKDAADQTVRGAQEPMDPEMVAAILAIDVKAIEATIGTERARHAASGLDKRLPDECVQNGLHCLVMAQSVLRKHRDNPPTLEQFVSEFGQEVVAAFPP